MREIKLQEIKDKFDVDLGLFGQPPIAEDYRGGYSIRIRTGAKVNYRLGTTSISWDYFITDKDGVIIKSPRGFAQQYNKKVKITDIKEEYQVYKKLRTDQDNSNEG